VGQAMPGEGQQGIVGEIQKLSQLHQQGVLSDAEFEAAKQKVLS
jgi:hypothetical protein